MGFDIGGLVGNLLGKVVSGAAQSLFKGIAGGGGGGGFDFGKIFSDAIQSMFKDTNATGNKAASKAGDDSDFIKKEAGELGAKAGQAVTKTVGTYLAKTIDV